MDCRFQERIYFIKQFCLLFQGHFSILTPTFQTTHLKLRIEAEEEGFSCAVKSITDFKGL